jgi:ATP-dependent DNA ligase
MPFAQNGIKPQRIREPKLRLRSVVLGDHRERLLYCDHIEQEGEGLFRLACEHDLEGVVAKWKSGLYLPERETTWLEVRNRQYSQWAGRVQSVF